MQHPRVGWDLDRLLEFEKYSKVVLASNVGLELKVGGCAVVGVSPGKVNPRPAGPVEPATGGPELKVSGVRACEGLWLS